MTEIDGATGRPQSTTTLQFLYILHFLSPFTLWSLSLLAVIIGAFVRDSARGTWQDSHYSWLLRTFLWGILWFIITSIVFTITVIGFFLLFIPWGILTIWYLYRVIRGWLRLNEGQPAP